MPGKGYTALTVKTEFRDKCKKEAHERDCTIQEFLELAVEQYVRKR